MKLAAALGVAAFVVYLLSLPPSFAFWDTGELQTVAAILGIAHPPACPVFVLLGWVAVHALPFGEPAWRVDVMCAFAVALAVALLQLTARRFGVPPAIAALCTVGFALAGVTWRDATRAEVHDLALVLRVAALFFALRYYDAGRRRDLFVAALAFGLALATHGIAVLLAPALAVLVAARGRWKDPRAYAIGAAGIVLGLVPYAYLPLRSAAIAARQLDPTVALGLAPGSQPFWDYDHPATWPNFVRVLTAADFDVHSGFAGFIAVKDYPRFAAALVKRLADAYGYGGALLAIGGIVRLVARRDAGAYALALAALVPAPYAESYNELQDPDRYYLLALWCGAIGIGAGFEFLADLIALRVRTIGRYALAGALAASFVASTSGRERFFDQRYDRNAERYVADVIAATPDDAIVVAEWAYATPLAYAAYVQHAFGGRTVVSAAPRQYVDRYRTWLATRPVFVVTFDDALTVPGFVVSPAIAAYYHGYRLTLPVRGATR